MRVLLVNTSQQTGGAAIAAHRLMEALNNNGVKARMLVRDAAGPDANVLQLPPSPWLKAKFVWERVQIWAANDFRRHRLFEVDNASCGTDITRLPAFREADVVHLHWVNQGFLSLADIGRILRSGKPVAWTLHDMWPLTGICHHAYGCTRFTESCHHCPFLLRAGANDLAARVFRRKQRMLAGQTMQVVAVSHWLAGLAEQSALTCRMPVSVIPNPISLSRFTQIDRRQARADLGLPERKIIAFGAARIDAPVKGFDYLIEALRRLVARGKFGPDEVHLVLFGTIKNRRLLDMLPVAHTHLGLVSEAATLSRIYSAANVLASSSLYETFGQTLIEAQACGCLPVAFGGSGQQDIIEHKTNGYLAEWKSAESLAEGLEWALQTHISPHELRLHVEKNFSENTVARHYVDLYNQIAKTKA